MAQTISGKAIGQLVVIAKRLFQCTMQSTYRPGVISTILDRLAPIGRLAGTIGLQSWINGFVDWAIGQYQRHLSPRKGFTCAHRKLHGGASCSGYFRELVTTAGFTNAIQPFQQRLVDCRKANDQLRLMAAATAGEPFDAPTETTEADRPSSDNADLSSSACECGGYALQGGCDAIDFSACEFPHFSACDAGAGDLGGCDVGACDFGGCDCSF
jgi:putative component of membrane protein insertase Oxa1/YidC/SpoIIIJ protein YidD